MRNSDINSRFEDWLLNPTESLDFEVKQWLDLNDPEARGAIAKALIALENHGGGFLLIGYKDNGSGRLEPDENRPVNLDVYNTDAINAIVKKCAEPGFHVDVTLQRHPERGVEFPLIRVPGTSRVPVRSCSATAGKTLHQNVYYIRRPGPESDSPKTGGEWDQLLRRCMLAQRDEIISVLKAFLPTGGLTPVSSKSEDDKLREFSKDAKARWVALNSSLPDDHPSKIKFGYFAFSARITGNSRGLSTKEVLESLERARKYTGWPALVVLHQEATRPKLVDGALQAWLCDLKYPDSAHADFWRIDAQGNFYLLRGMQEDSLSAHHKVAEPGTVLDATLPVWRLGEFLLRINELGNAMFEDGYEVIVECEWTGLNGRRLTILSHRRFLGQTHSSAQDVVITSGQFTQNGLQDMLPEVVKSLISPLYEVFDLFQPVDSLYAEELEEMKKGSRNS